MSSLIELLIATFILAIGLLGILTVENTALARSYDSYLSSIANIRLGNISECLTASTDKAEYKNWDMENINFLPNAHSSLNGNKTFTEVLNDI